MIVEAMKPLASLYLADGAIASCTPVQQARARRDAPDRSADGLCLCAPSSPRDAVANALHALTLLITRQMLSELESLSDGIEYHVAPPLYPLIGSPYDFSHANEPPMPGSPKVASSGGRFLTRCARTSIASDPEKVVEINR